MNLSFYKPTENFQSSFQTERNLCNSVMTQSRPTTTYKTGGGEWQVSPGMKTKLRGLFYIARDVQWL